MRSIISLVIISLVGIALVGSSIWYGMSRLPLDPSGPIGVPLLVLGVLLISAVLAIEHFV